MLRMRMSLRAARELLDSPLRAERLGRAVRAAAWPLLRRVAWAHRRTLLRQVRVMAVTGSFGKTTTNRAIAAALGLPQPDGSNHSARLALALLHVSRRARRCALEVGIDRPGQMRDMASMVRPDVAVLTGIGSEHNRSFPRLEDTLAEKSELIRALGPRGVTVLNADDPLARSASAAAPGEIVTYGFSAEADVRVTDHALNSLEGARFSANVRGREVELQTRLLGRHQVYPILAALAVAHIEGVDLESAKQRLEALPPAYGRMQLIRLPVGAALINDSFKGALEGYLTALDAIKDLPAERRVLILGDINEPPGTQSEAYKALGAGLARVPQALIVHVGRDGKRLRAGARKAGINADEILCLAPDALPALERIRELIRPTDLVLVKGRSTQKLDRIVAGLRGATVRCGVRYCNRPVSECLKCPIVAA